MNNLLLRAVSGSIYVLIILFCILMGATWFWAVISIFAILALHEVQSTLNHTEKTSTIIRGFDLCSISIYFLLLGFSLIFTNQSQLNDCFLYIFIAASIYISLRVVIAVYSRSQASLFSFMASAMSMAYIAVPLTCLILSYILGGKNIVLATFVFIWLNDTGAYLSGITLGRHKLCQRLSPKKSWEGFWGGFILCVIGGIVASYILYGELSILTLFWAIYAAVVSVAGTFGDLFESLIKRKNGVKDSGKIIPGHGGILDRIDSLLAVNPFTLLFVLILNLFFN